MMSTTTNFFLLLVAFTIGSGGVASATATPSIFDDEAPSNFLSPTEKYAQALVEWINSPTNGGYVSDKISLRRMIFDDNDDSDGDDNKQQQQKDSIEIMGVFATKDISKNETLLKIPRKLYLSLTDEEIKDTETYQRKDATMEEIMKVYFSDTCRLAQKLIKEWKAHDNNKKKKSSTISPYGPYLDYLKTQPKGALPATYSPTGKELLRGLSGPVAAASGGGKKSPNYGSSSLPPWQFVDWIDEQFVQTGCISKGDELGYHAVALAIQRGYDCEFIPIWDMVNHNNGKLNVETNSLRSKEGLHVWASKDIKAGQEIYATYNYCTDCYDIGDEWGTPGIYRDFGFVEDYPQVWPFLDHDIYYEVDLLSNDDSDDDDEDESGGTNDEEEDSMTMVAKFVRDSETGEIPYGLPNAEGLKYLERELARVVEWDIPKQLEAMGTTKAALLKPHELEMITKYHRSLIIALKAGIEATQKEMLMQNKDNNNDDDEDGSDQDATATTTTKTATDEL